MPRAIRFPKAIVKGADLDFSFSGLKTALLHHVQKHGVPEGRALADLCASYQEAIVRALVREGLPGRAPAPVRPAGALRRRGRQQPAARGRARERAAEYEGMQVFVPPVQALHRQRRHDRAWPARTRSLRGERAGPDLNADPAWRL